MLLLLFAVFTLNPPRSPAQHHKESVVQLTWICSFPVTGQLVLSRALIVLCKSVDRQRSNVGTAFPTATFASSVDACSPLLSR